MLTAGVARRPSKPQLAAVALVVVLLALAAIPTVALWRAFGPRTNVAPDFTLTDQNGAPFTLSALRGRPVVIFFGYTHCPDTCPATLARLARAVAAPGVPRDVRVAFITVDPKRDSPATLKRYLRMFGAGFTGLTGSLSALEPVYTAYDAWREDVPVEGGGRDYAVAHSAALYFIGRTGAIKGFGDWQDGIPSLISHLKEFQ